MFSFFFVVFISVCFAQQRVARNGQIAELRIFNQLFATPANISGTPVPFSNPTLTATIAVGANAVAAGVHGRGLGNFQTVDLGGSTRTITLSHSNGGDEVNKVVCTASILPNTRNTVFIDMDVVNQQTTVGVSAAAGPLQRCQWRSSV